MNVYRTGPSENPLPRPEFHSAPFLSWSHAWTVKVILVRASLCSSFISQHVTAGVSEPKWIPPRDVSPTRRTVTLAVRLRRADMLALLVSLLVSPLNSLVLLL